MCQIMAEGDFVRVVGGCTVWNTLNKGGREKRGEETKISKRREHTGSRGGWLKKEGTEDGTLLQTKADLPQLAYEETCSTVYFKIKFLF